LPKTYPGEDIAWKALTNSVSLDVCRRTLAQYRESDGCYLLRALGDDYEIAPRQRTIECPSNHSFSPDIDFRVMVLAYLTNAKDIELSGKLAQCYQLRGGDSFFRGAHRLPVQELEARFGKSPRKFKEVCSLLDGRDVPYGDVSVEVKTLPRLPLTFVLWVADDEFPARVSVLFDSTADEHLPLDALLATVRTAVKHIVARSQEG